MRKCRSGLTLAEMAVVVIIISVLAAFAIPRFLASVERSKAAEAFNYLAAVQAAQERYHAREGTYASKLADLDIKPGASKYFTIGEVSAGRTNNLENSWKLTLTRTGASAGYGEYTVTFCEEGFDSGQSSITEIPSINPMQT